MRENEDLWDCTERYLVYHQNVSMLAVCRTYISIKISDTSRITTVRPGRQVWPSYVTLNNHYSQPYVQNGLLKMDLAYVGMRLQSPGTDPDEYGRMLGKDGLSRSPLRSCFHERCFFRHNSKLNEAVAERRGRFVA